MDRKQKVLQFLNVDGQGIEIGPSHNPIASKRNGFKVHIIDHLSQSELVEKYKSHNVNLENIEPVDFIWTGQSYAELTGKNKFYDWIIASHVIEHTPDLIGFLNNCDAILKDDGVISLVIPDKRYCFDYFRPITGIAKIIDSHFRQEKIHTPGTAAEYYLNVVRKGGSIAWAAESLGKYEFVHSLQNARDETYKIVNNHEYLDLHAWCFTPHSFRLIIDDLYSLGYINVKEVGFFPTDGSEFYVTLGRTGKGISLDRIAMLNIIDSELSRKETHINAPAKNVSDVVKILSQRIKKMIFVKYQ